jgi:hypothetical protein
MAAKVQYYKPRDDDPNDWPEMQSMSCWLKRIMNGLRPATPHRCDQDVQLHTVDATVIIARNPSLNTASLSSFLLIPLTEQ